MCRCSKNTLSMISSCSSYSKLGVVCRKGPPSSLRRPLTARQVREGPCRLYIGVVKEYHNRGFLLLAQVAASSTFSTANDAVRDYSDLHC